MKPLLIALASLLLLSAPAAAQDRRQIPVQRTWNLADIFPDRAAWQQARQALQARIPELAALKGHVADSAASLLKALTLREDLQRQAAQVSAYAWLTRDQDSRVAEGQEMTGLADEVIDAVATAAAFIPSEILDAGPPTVQRYLAQEPALRAFEPILDDVLRRKAHTLAPDQEALYARCKPMGETASAVREVLVDANLPFPEATLSSGEKVRLNRAGYERVRTSTVRADRVTAYQRYFETYKAYGDTLGALLYGHVKSNLVARDVRKYPSCLEASLDDANIPPAVYTRLVAETRASLPVLHRYLRLRKTILGLDELRYEDLYTPVAQRTRTSFPLDDAMALTLEAVQPLGPAYVATLKQAYRDRWFDFLPSDGKYGNAYAMTVYGVHPYVLLNYGGTYSDVSTLAHESGHAMHSWLTDHSQRFALSEYKTFVAEVASTVNENLLFQRMLENAKDDDTRLFLLGQRAEMYRTSLFRQVLFADFELRIHQMVESGEALTGESLTKLYRSILREYYGPDCKIDDLYGWEWAHLPHFFWDSFYVYQYATSLVAANAITAQLPARGPEAYLTMLKSGCARHPTDLLKAAGVDMTTGQPFKASIEDMSRILDQMEALLKE